MLAAQLCKLRWQWKIEVQNGINREGKDVVYVNISISISLSYTIWIIYIYIPSTFQFFPRQQVSWNFPDFHAWTALRIFCKASLCCDRLCWCSQPADVFRTVSGRWMDGALLIYGFPFSLIFFLYKDLKVGCFVMFLFKMGGWNLWYLYLTTQPRHKSLKHTWTADRALAVGIQNLKGCNNILQYIAQPIQGNRDLLRFMKLKTAETITNEWICKSIPVSTANIDTSRGSQNPV